MDAISKNDREALLAVEQSPCSSIYIPTGRIAAAEDATRLKNCLRTAHESLRAVEVAERDARSILKPVDRLIEEQGWPREPGEGLAVFCAREFFRHFRLPRRPEERTVVDRRFHITPLIPFLAAHDRFFVLAISANRVRLLRGNGSAVVELTVDGLPHNLPDALQLEEPERMAQAHGGIRHGQAGRSTVFHGQGGASDHVKENLVLFFRQVDRALHGVLHDQAAPLVFAGVDYLFPLYRSANTYAHLAHEHVSGNPDRLSPQELRDKVQGVLRSQLDRARQAAVERCTANRPECLTSVDLEKLVIAAEEGQVETLFVAGSPVQWGAFDRQARKLHLHAEQTPQSEDVVNLAVVETLRHRGNVYPAKRGELPNSGPIVALLRYP